MEWIGDVEKTKNKKSMKEERVKELS